MDLNYTKKRVNIEINIPETIICLLILLIGLMTSFVWAYNFGRVDQIEISRASLQVIPDVNCGKK